MGYERKIYIVSEVDFSDYAETIAMFDLCKCGEPCMDRLFKENATKKLFSDDMNSTIDEDMYGDHIKCEEPEKVIDALRSITDYWRAQVLADLIDDILQRCDTRDTDHIMVYQFGY